MRGHHGAVPNRLYLTHHAFVRPSFLENTLPLATTGASMAVIALLEGSDTPKVDKSAVSQDKT
jgi:hypothetical protein